MKITLCLLTFNELEGCKHDIPLIQREMFDEIYAVDGGSSDGTIEYLQNQGITVYKQPKKGLNPACRFAFEKCTTDALIFFHPKGTIPVSDTLKFRKYFNEGYELVVGSRSIKGAVNEEDTKLLKPRKWFVKALAIVASLIFKREGKMVWDVLHGFRGATVNAFKKIDPLDYGLSIDIEMVVRSYKFKIRRVEFPTTEVPRIAGETHFKAIPTGIKLLKYLYYELFTRKDKDYVELSVKKQQLPKNI
ncbi:glycosyltransferase [Paenibacillus piri]|uniref:Glycosyltransferase n=1 Tax=Paenibacillus piri TaxID=2547395 RepID=A0A4V2ZT96_9BACL|nr:glycosyltransferase [Paenibacillus piri]TDF96214.1 glycosyltransferase [Paenibacillus piri]